MTQGERPRRRDRRRSAADGDSATDPKAADRAQNRVLLTILAVLVVVLCVLLAYLLRNRDTTPPGTEAGPAPKPLFSITGPGKGDAPDFVRPLSAAWAANGDIYVSDTGNGRICVFSGTGRFLREFGRSKSSKPGAETAVLQQPGGISLAPDGNVYVADIRAGAIVVFDARGSLVKRIFPRAPTTTGRRHWAPTDVAVSSDRIYVTDAAGVAIFSADGSPGGRIDKAGGAAFAYPNGVALRSDGTLVISDTNNGRVVSVEATGPLVWVSGPSDASQRIIGLPRGLAVAHDGSILVADAFLFGITRVSDRGVFIERYGNRGPDLGFFEFPNDVAVRGDLVVVADKENNRVQVIQWPGLLGMPKK